MNKLLKILIACTGCFLLLTCGVLADENFDGYIVRLSESISENVGSQCAVLFGDEEITESYTAEYAAELLSESVEDVSEVRADKGLVKVDSLETLEWLKQSGIVEYYDENVCAELYGYDPELNPYYSKQWHLPAVKAEYAWKAGIFGSSVRVGVIDSGVFPNEDLKDALAEGYNYYLNNTDAAGYAVRHGTNVASIIAAQCNDIGTVGIAHKAKIVPLKVVNDDSPGTIPLEYIVKAIYGAVDDFDCDVINMSFGFKTSPLALKEAVDYAESKGSIMVAAAGNDGSDSEFPYRYPASYDNVVSVANAQVSGDTYDIRDTSQKNDKLDIAAPGTYLYMADNNENGVYRGTGTSFACPVVSAAAALVKSIDPLMNQSDFMYYLKETADSSYLTAQTDSDSWGAGMLDIEALIKMVLVADGKKAYLSKVDVSFDGDTSIYIHNPTSDTQYYTLSIKAFRPKHLIFDFDLAPYKTLEFLVSSYKCYGETSFSAYDRDGKLIDVQQYSFENPDYETFKPGDVNLDGKVDTNDVLVLQRYLAWFDGVNLPEEALQCADVNADGFVDSRDIVRLLQYLAGWAVELN